MDITVGADFLGIYDQNNINVAPVPNDYGVKGASRVP